MTNLARVFLFSDLTQECEAVASGWQSLGRGEIDAFEFRGKRNALTSIGSGNQSAPESLRHIARSVPRKRTTLSGLVNPETLPARERLV